MSDLRYIVMAAGRKSRPVTLEQILEMCAAGKIAPDATVATEGSTLHRPILVFLGETQTSAPVTTHESASSLTDANRSESKGRSWLKPLGILLLIWMGWNGWTVYQLYSQLNAQRDQLIEGLGGLQNAVDQVAAAQARQEQQQQPAPVEQIQDPLAGRPPAEQQKIRQIISAFGEYNNILQQLANEGQGNSPAARGAEESIERLMEQLKGFGLGGEPPTQGNPSYSNR